MSQTQPDTANRVPLSHTLGATVMRAKEYARRQGHRHFTLEHLLLALIEDHDAGIVLTSCNVDLSRVGADVSGYLGRLDDRVPPGMDVDPAAHGDLIRIIEYATAAARQSRRREINGAIVLAAIVGEGRSTAAGILRAQGLTFEEAIRALQRATAAGRPQPDAEQPGQPPSPVAAPAPASSGPPPAARPAPQTAEQILAGARERVEASRQHTAPPVPAAPVRAPVTQPGPPASEQNAAPPPAPASPASAPPSGPAVEAASPPERTVTAPPPEIAAEHPASAPSPAAARAADQSGHSPPPPSPQAAGRPQPAPPLPPQPAPAAAPRAPIAAPSAPQPPSPAPSLRDFERPEVTAAPPLPLQPQPVAAPEPGQRTGPPPLAPGWAPPPQPPSTTPHPLPPRAREEATPPRLPRHASLPGGPLPAPHPHAHQHPGPPTGAPAAPRQPSPPPWQPATEARARPLDSLSQPPAQPMPAGAARQMPPAGQPHPAGPPQVGAPPPRHTPATGSISGLADGQLVERIPRKMRVGIPETVEIRIAKADVQNLSVGIEGRGAPMRHDLIVTRAMSVRLRAPDGGFAIDPASPETQWIENRLGLMSDDYASWRWTITPLRRGPARLQLVVAAKTVGTDGLAADTALPDQIIEIAISTNYRQSALKWGGWAAAAVIGGVLARFGDGIVAIGSSLIGR